MSGKERNFVNVIICIHDTFKYIKPKLDIFSEVALLVQADEKSFLEKVKSDIKVNQNQKTVLHVYMKLYSADTLAYVVM